MLLRLARQTYVRQYGEFTYLFGRVTAFDQVFVNAEVFLKFITREPREKGDILKDIFAQYSDAPTDEIQKDFDEFLAPLLVDHVVLSGNSAQELNAQEPCFTYDSPDPKTVESKKFYTKEESEALPAAKLEKYFSNNPTLFEIQLDITQACTERCRHCYVPEYNPLFLPYDKICEILDEFRLMGGLHVSLSGGECMLHPDFMRIVRAIRERDCTVCCLSNLTVCSEENIKTLVDADGTIQVSLYSMSPSIHDQVTKRKGSWIETVGAILRLRAANIPVRIACPCLRLNYKGYPDVIKFAESLKMTAQTDFIIMGKQDCDTSNLCNRLNLAETRELLEDVILKAIPMDSEYFSPGKKKYMLSDEEWTSHKVCGACVNSMCLSPNGDYYPCPGFAGVTLGNCFKNSLYDVWMKSTETKRIRSITGNSFPSCVHCKDRDYCSVCMCRNYNETGDMFKPAQHFCDVARINHEVVDEAQKRRMGYGK